MMARKLEVSIRIEMNEVPTGFEQGLGFADAYYVNDQLTAIFVTSARDFAFVIDESSGRVIRTYETR